MSCRLSFEFRVSSFKLCRCLCIVIRSTLKTSTVEANPIFRFPGLPHLKLATRNSQLATCNSKLETRKACA
jgi:hypothetical protein